MIHVDLDHARVSARDGEPVFLPQGGQSPYLQRIVTVLRGINEGVAAGKAMYAALDALELVQPIKVDVRFDAEHGANLTGLWGIDRERLAALDAEQIASLHNVRRLIAQKQRRLRETAGAAPAN